MTMLLFVSNCVWTESPEPPGVTYFLKDYRHFKKSPTPRFYAGLRRFYAGLRNCYTGLRRLFAGLHSCYAGPKEMLRGV